MFDLKSLNHSSLMFLQDMIWCLKIMVLLAECVDHIQFGLEQLQADLESGAWYRAHGHLLAHESLSIGYKLVTAMLH